MAATLSASFYRLRDAIAAGPSLLAVVVLITLQYDRAVVVHFKDERKPVEVKLIDAAPEPLQQPTPQPPTPAPPQKSPVQPTEPSKPVPQQAQPSQQVVTTDAPSTESAPAQPAPVAPPPPKAVESAPPVPPVRPVAANLEGDYVAKVRGYLNASKRYPTGREASLQHPRGTVKVWFILRRDGSLVDSGIDESSNSMLLDDAARKTISRATYPAFPDSSWAGEATHRFTTELEFIPPG